MLATALASAALLGFALILPPVSLWIHAFLILAWHKFQVWNHRIYDRYHPMAEFEQKYKKGPQLFALLALYELPILLNFFVSIAALRHDSATRPQDR